MKLTGIGMRNTKTAVSVFICLLIFEIVNRENSFYACIAAVICMQATVDNSLKSGISRIVGTVIGGFLGVVLFAIGETYMIEQLFIILIPIGIIILIETCVSLGKKGSVSICCVVYLSIMINHRYEGDYFWYAVNRVLDTSIGIIVAVIINRYLNIPKIFRKNKDAEENTDIPK